MPVLNAAYNYPSRTVTRCPWDVFFDVSFIYWQPTQENMELGLLTTTYTGTSKSQELNPTFNYKPGFKIGLGGNFDHDNWDMHGEYTWFHNTNSSSTGLPVSEAGVVNGINPAWGSPNANYGTSNSYSTAAQKWTLDMDLLDLDLGRWYYVGTKLTCRPSFGLRGAVIKQQANQTYTNDNVLVGTVNTLTVKNKSNSWAIGPKFALDSNWVIGSGFRLFGNAEADVLYTRYTKLSSDLKNTSVTFVPEVFTKQSSVGTLRTHIDLVTGLGWGTYIDCNNWYLDFSAGYEFQVFFDQNAFRFFSDNVMHGKSFAPNGNLYLQGLTLTARLDF